MKKTTPFLILVTISSMFMISFISLAPSCKGLRQSTINKLSLQPFNIYSHKNGNLSVMLVIDDKFNKSAESFAGTFESWVAPFEKKFQMKFHFYGFKIYPSVENDSLFDSIDKIYTFLPWIPATSPNDPLLSKNGYDLLIVFQYHYNGGRNHANALLGNALIFSFEQPGYWASAQLVLLHELGHIFGGTHDDKGNVPENWYGTANRSIMDYGDLTWMTWTGNFNESDLPIDDHNYEVMFLKDRTAEYGFPNYCCRFDLNDPDQDGIPNWFEYSFDTDPVLNDSLTDSDNDGLTNKEEWLLGTRPDRDDTDGDNADDGWEISNGYDPLDPTDFTNVDNSMSSSDSTSLNDITTEETSSETNTSFNNSIADSNNSTSFDCFFIIAGLVYYCYYFNKRKNKG